jgi:hypothetical protein
MNQGSDSHSVQWLIEAICCLPSDDPVPDKTPGYNRYNTQKDHWLGWLRHSETGTYLRRSDDNRGAQHIYNQIGEPRMLLWLISAAGVSRDLLNAATKAAEAGGNLRTIAGDIRKLVPWSVVAAALSKVHPHDGSASV